MQISAENVAAAQRDRQGWAMALHEPDAAGSCCTKAVSGMRQPCLQSISPWTAHARW